MTAHRAYADPDRIAEAIPPSPQPLGFFRPWTFRPPREIPPRRWLYGAHYIRRFVSTTAALGGAGKSALALVEAMAMASGKPLLGVAPAGRLRVGYFNAEDPLEETERRIAAAMMHFGLTRADLEGWLHWGSGRDSGLVIAVQGREGVEIVQPVVDRLLADITEQRLDAIIVDPFVSTHRVPENANGEIDFVVKQWARIAETADIGVELVHHTKKSSGVEMTVEDSRGASSYLNAARSARVLNVMTKEEAERAGVDQRRAHFRVDNGKANLAPPSERSAWFRFVGVDLGNGGDEPGDSVGVVTSWQWPDSLDGIRAADLLRVQQKIASGAWREDSRSDAWAGNAIAEALDLNLDAPGQKARLKGMLSTWLAAGALKRVTLPDAKRRSRTFVEVGTWAE